MFGRGEIDAYHNDVISDVWEVLGKRVIFFPPGERKWHRVPADSQVGFELIAEDPLERETAERGRGEDTANQKVFVLPLCARSSACGGAFWVSWHETWRKKGSERFILLNSGWTLFEGQPGDPRKYQVLRADWDQLPHMGSLQAGHPHWHFDDELFISAGLATVEVAPGLFQTTTGTAPEMPKRTSMGFIHLAMGAWNRGMDHPGCWQRTYEDDCQQLRDWCKKTLKYLKEQVAGS